MARVPRAVATAILLAGPAALAFFSGGFFDRPRLAAAVVAWALVLIAAAVAPRPLPREPAPRIALAGMVALTLWSGLSLTWAPLSGPALDDLQRLLLLLGALVAATALLHPRAAARAAEPALAAGAVVVVGYGLSGRLLPGLIELEVSRSAAGRLDQPLTYWNAMGALAVLGLILSARIAGDHTRPALARAAAAAACVPAGAGVYLSFSRGAILALVAGFAMLVAAARTRAQLRAAGLALVAAALGSVACGAFAGVRALEGDLGARETQGAAALALLLALCAAAAFAQQRLAGDGTELRLPRFPRWASALVAVAGIGAVVGAAAAENSAERPGAAAGADVARLGSLQSNRLDYWDVALRAFADHPLRGTGIAGFRVEWLREREISEPAEDAHSLYLETAGELGAVGLAALALFIAGVGWSGARALAGDRALAAGPVAALVALALHAGLDWDWEMPALALVGILLAGLLCGTADRLASADPG